VLEYGLVGNCVRRYSRAELKHEFHSLGRIRRRRLLRTSAGNGEKKEAKECRLFARCLCMHRGRGAPCSIPCQFCH
jgi:hypothetical protein